LHEYPNLALHLYRPLAHAELGQLVEILRNLLGDEQPAAGAELSDPLAGADELVSALL
jgi:hypothetical protein